MGKSRVFGIFGLPLLRAPALVRVEAGGGKAVKPSTGDFQSQITTISCKFYNHHQKLDCGCLPKPRMEIRQKVLLERYKN